MNNRVEPKVIVALDFDDKQQALSLVEQLDESVCKLKVGKQMFTLFGPDFVKYLVNKKFDVFLDLKFHDIPNTVAKACLAAADLGVWMLNVHASGGSEMMQKSQQALESLGTERPRLIAVTVLTSMDQQQLHAVGIHNTPEQQVLHLATMAQQAGLDGVVCSAQEASELKRHLGKDVQLVTPGIRPEGSQQDDQKRIMTPPQAIQAGVDYMVIGRPITQADNPLAALQAINQSITGVC